MPEARIALDMFPAAVSLESGARHPVSRVTLVDGRVKVWIQNDAGISTVYDAPYLSFEGNRLRGFSVLTDGGTVHVTRAGGCGCAFKTLRNFDPYDGATRMFVKE